MLQPWLRVSLAVILAGSALHATVWSQPPAPRYASEVSVYDLRTRSARVVYRGEGIWEAPNWSRDGSFLLVNSGGRLFRIALAGPLEPQPLAVDPSLGCNNDHDFSADGRWLAISASSSSSRQSQVYVANADGTGHRLVVAQAPSYFHGWSADSKYLAFVANRDGKQYDIYRAPAAGGDEERLTFDPADDDGPDYSPDGRWIYFNSNRGGGWNVWRMPAQGAGAGDSKAERITGDDLEDWFPHPSPDGKSLVFLSFPHGTKGHNDRTLKVQLRLRPMPGERVDASRPESLLVLSGGQGTINVNSWAPDSTRFAFVSYAVVTAASGN